MSDALSFGITDIDGAFDSIIYEGLSRRLTPECWVANLCAVAELTIVAQGRIYLMDNLVVYLITAIGRARHTIVHNRCDTRLTSSVGIAGLGAVAKRAVVSF